MTLRNRTPTSVQSNTCKKKLLPELVEIVQS